MREALNQMARRSISGFGAILGSLLGALYLAPSALAICASYHGDPGPPGFHGLACHFETGSTESWTVPPNSATPRITLYGAGDAVGGSGGRVEVKLPVVSGETLELVLGSQGSASSIVRSGSPVLVAGGGDGREANYIDPSAEVIDIEAPGQPAGRFPGNGSVYIEWYDARDPADLVGPKPNVIFDFFDTENFGFPYKGTPQKWVVPEGVDRATFELWGGPGESGAPHGHVLAGYRVSPGDAFNVWVGGPGEDTTLTYADGWPAVAAMAAGGDSERPNYVFPPASPAESLYEGGGNGSSAGSGYAIVHFSPPEKPTIDHPFTTERPADGSLPTCVVPRLRGKTPRAARRLLTHANCTLGSVTRKPSRANQRGRIISQAMRAGTHAAADSAVAVTVGKRP
jgi:hypothetical protein